MHINLKSKFLAINAAKITKSLQFTKDDILTLENTKFHTKILLKKEIPDLRKFQRTWHNGNRVIIVFMICTLCIPLLFRKWTPIIIIERSLFEFSKDTPKNYKEDFDEFINAIKI